MKTKNILTAGFVAALSLLSSCSDSFLEIDPSLKETAETYFTTEERVQEGLVAAYNPMHVYDFYWRAADDKGQYCSINVSSDVMADIVWVGAQDITDQSHWHKMANFESTPLDALWGVWEVSYQGVKRANDVFNFIEWAKADLTDAQYKAIEAEARVLRSFYYTQLWKFYGYIPYYRENLSYPYLKEQSTPDEVYEQIVDDLEAAIDANVLPMRWDTENLGRMSQATAYMLYADVVMYQKDETRYAKALNYMRQIIRDTNYDLDGDYAHIFTSNGEWGPESIFEIVYSDGVNQQRGYLYANTQIGGTILPKVISPEGGVAADGVSDGWGACVIRQETYDMYAANDTRRDATCYVAPAGAYKPRFQDTGIFLNKYLGRTANSIADAGSEHMKFNNNLRIYRYAETLLNAAELLVRTGGDLTEAKSYLTKVRNRAGLVSEKEATIDNIIEERKLEFVGEGKRYWDLVRTGKAATVLTPDTYGNRTRAWNEHKKYLPIPQDEINAAQGTLHQNDDYLNN